MIYHRRISPKFKQLLTYKICKHILNFVHFITLVYECVYNPSYIIVYFLKKIIDE